jgi:hypothetical protein
VGGNTPGDVELHLERGGTLTGTVRHASGDLAPEAAVFVRRQGSDVAGVVVREVADERGAFLLEPVPPGRVVVIARQGGAWGQSRPLDVAPGVESSVEVVLKPATVLGVTALEAEHPAPNASLAVVDPTGLDHASLDYWFGSSATYAGATHTVGPLPPGRYRVRARFSDGAVVERELTVDGEPALSLELAHP